MGRKNYPRTPDGRYFVAKARLWRCTDPSIPDEERRAHVKALMKARLAVRKAGQANDDDLMREARDAVQQAKVALGERGAVWWDDGTADVGRKHPKNTLYADWWAGLTDEERAAGGDAVKGGSAER